MLDMVQIYNLLSVNLNSIRIWIELLLMHCWSLTAHDNMIIQFELPCMIVKNLL